MQPKTCAHCQHYRPSDEESATGECRLNPPQMLHSEEEGPYSIFPQVDSEDYCSRWELAK
jgi:hypothetical protein